ncbi:MAG TPA: radical SAM family heme chaperone HemW [Pyrinomonadaceae bacterium]|nr:radical SAM family heme chaperone HemW [Pyrinomonadaceae bacterium]
MAAGVYLHIPFCKSRCSYCDFATDVWRSSEAVERYTHALSREIESFAGTNPKSVDSIYLGGGTPSLLSPAQVKQIMDVVFEKFSVAAGVEITMEMNPATVTPETLAAYRDAGVNRASFGVQTFNDEALKLLARGHDANDARATFRMLREADFDNISFDLIAGLPGQTLDDWRTNLHEALAMRPEHLSLYLLEVHEATPLAEQIRSGRRPVPDEDLAAEMYELMVDTLESEGYGQYEISNFARPGRESRHNSKYWLMDPVYGFGVSAHSFDGTERYANERDTARYVELIEKESSTEVSRHEIDVPSESVFLGLRLTSGIDLAGYRLRFGIDLIEKHRDDIDRLVTDELVQTDDGFLRLTRRGMLFSNEVFSIFV